MGHQTGALVDGFETAFRVRDGFYRETPEGRGFAEIERDSGVQPAIAKLTADQFVQLLFDVEPWVNLGESGCLEEGARITAASQEVEIPFSSELDGNGRVARVVYHVGH